MEQLVARRAHNPEVGGSSPPPATRGNLLAKLFVLCLFKDKPCMVITELEIDHVLSGDWFVL